jgi:hypothetical protein
MKFVKSSILLIALLCATACNTSPASPLVLALDGISIAATVLPAAIPNLSPQAAACLNAVPDLVTTIATVVEGSQPLTAAQSAASGLQALLTTSCAMGAIPANDQALISGVAKAISLFISEWQSLMAKYAPTPEILAANTRTAHAFGFANTASPSTAKWKANRKDKATAKHARELAAKNKSALAKGGK